VAVHGGPKVSPDGLVLSLDGANLKSFKGVNATNILNGIYYQQSNQSSSLYKVFNGEENVYIPSIGYVRSKYVDFYNDYNGGSGACCPNLFSYGTGLSVSPSTTYTYSIIYKTTTGYTHPNYMYRYEYNSSGGYLTEGGVHSEGNRTSLGDGWWFAWGQFTTQATSATLNTYLFHYEYATQNRVYVYRAALYQGTYIIPPEHMLTSGQVRGTTVATGGGWEDLTGRGNNGELVNGPTYNSANRGSLSFDGVDDRVECGNFSVQYLTISTWVYKTSSTTNQGICRKQNGWAVSQYNGTLQVAPGTSWQFYDTGYTIPLNTWVNIVYTYSGTGSTGSQTVYINGSSIYSTTAGSGAISANSNAVRVGFDDNNWFWGGRISQTQIYNRALTASEIQQNYISTKSRYGL